MSSPSDPKHIGLVGAGLVGQQHIKALSRASGVQLAALADPDPQAAGIAKGAGVPLYPDLDAMLAAGGLDGIYLATPNQLHLPGGLACIAAGLPVLIEKPLAATLVDAQALVDAAQVAGVPLAVGHHRRHSAVVRAARAMIDDGTLGRIVVVHGSTWLMKPDDYFNMAWRREPGAGPVLINLIHDIDLLQYLCGPIMAVQAMAASDIRGFAVEDTAAITLRFASGALGTVSVTDTAAAPWSWELTAQENPAYPATGQDCYHISGTHGALALPDLTLWSHDGARSWWEPITPERREITATDPLIAQAEQFGRVLRGEEAPLVTGQDGLAALAVLDAIKSGAASGEVTQVTLR